VPQEAGAYLVIADILWDKGKLAQASKEFRATTKQFPKSRIASLSLFYILWAQSKTDAAFDEMKRFQSISFCRDYEEMVNEILQQD
jgi:predicted negative regulator of RcsB-dependent stress response